MSSFFLTSGRLMCDNLEACFLSFGLNPATDKLSRREFYDFVKESLSYADSFTQDELTDQNLRLVQPDLDDFTLLETQFFMNNLMRMTIEDKQDDGYS